MANPLHGSPQSGTSGDVWELAARGGYAVSGVLHLILGFLIAKIGVGSGAEADQGTAIANLGKAPVGTALLWVAVVAFVALAAWQVADALRNSLDASDRLKAAGKAVMYLALAFTAAKIAFGSGGSGSGDQQAQGFAGTLMQAPAGRILVGVVGLGILAGGAYHVFKGVTKKFLEDLKGTGGGSVGAGVRALGTWGYTAKGVALGAVGVLFVASALTADPSKAQGIDGAIQALLGAPGGQVIVVVVGLGFAAYGLYSFARARYARM